jgi:processive 1,2-diacylglycerol beta-glucosyltransferase
MKRQTLVLALGTLLAFQNASADKARHKIAIVYASLGNGHKSAAFAIKEALEREAAARGETIEVVPKDLLEFMDPMTRKIVTDTFKKMTQNAPDIYNLFWKDYIRKIQTVDTVGDMPIVEQYAVAHDFSTWLHDGQFTHINFTFNHGAELGVHLKNMGLIPPGLEMSFQHTDFVDDPYFAGISKEVDMTFVGHPGLEKSWIEQYGVDPKKVKATGIPVSPEAKIPLSAAEKAEFLAQKGLDAGKTTITLMSGINAIGDFPTIIRSLSRNREGPVQIVAICGTNSVQASRVRDLQRWLPDDVTLKVEEFIPTHEVQRYMKSSDLFIGKAGGLSSTEIFTMGIVPIFLDNNGGQERKNIRFFFDHGLGVGTKNQFTIGRLAWKILKDKDLQKKWLDNQKIFREELGNVGYIADWIMNASGRFNKTNPWGATVKILPQTPTQHFRSCLSKAIYDALHIPEKQ